MMVFGTNGCTLTPQPLEYHNDRDEKPGPGLFSGEAGGFVIMGESSKLKNPKNDPKTGSDNSVESME